MYLRRENRCLYAIHHNYIAIHSLPMYQLLNGWLAELSCVTNTTSTPIRIEDGGSGEP